MSVLLVFMSGCQTVLLKGLKGKGVVKTSKTFSQTQIAPVGIYMALTLSTPIHINAIRVIDIRE